VIRAPYQSAHVSFGDRHGRRDERAIALQRRASRRDPGWVETDAPVAANAAGPMWEGTLCAAARRAHLHGGIIQFTV